MVVEPYSAIHQLVEYMDETTTTTDSGRLVVLVA